MTQTNAMSRGRPWPIGASFDGDGVNFAVYSDHATRISVRLFDAENLTESQLLDLPDREGGIHYGYVAGLRPGAQYGIHADGPYDPEAGHRFNRHKMLLDPYARQLTGALVWHDALMGFEVGHDDADLSFDTRDSAPYMPRAVVSDIAPGRAAHPRHPMEETVFYEAHVKGLTQRHPTATPTGKFLALASEPMLDHLTSLGITAIELLPVHAFITDRFLAEQNLTNYWGYQTLGFFTPDPRYLAHGDIAEFRHTVDRLHTAGIEVILDVVYNHTCEGDQFGPTLSFRGLDNASYYRLAENPRHYINDTGTGNTVNTQHPMVVRMILDSLRYWTEVMGVDGFRFDLAATLGRTETGFDPAAPLLTAIRQDPVLSPAKLIAEPWDIGPGGYQVGAFPAPFAEWNDKFRDDTRRFWRGDGGTAPDLAARLMGSSLLFDHSGRPATTSVNKITAHDGFTLMDVVSYNKRHNQANGEDNEDGHGENFSDNLGVEGATDDPKIIAARTLRRRNMIATLLLSQGTPLVLAGDEIGHTQRGNNNAYAQDNETSWLDWAGADAEFLEFTRRLIALRRNHPVLRQRRFLHARPSKENGEPDLFWYRPDGSRMEDADWNDPELAIIAVEKRRATGTPVDQIDESAVFLVVNNGPATRVALPSGRDWTFLLDTSAPERPEASLSENPMAIAANSITLFAEASP